MVSITRWDPVGETVSLRQAMDRLVEDSFVSPLSWRTVRGEQLNPALDMHQADAT